MGVTMRGAWDEFVRRSGLPIRDEAALIADAIAPEMARYGELIQSPGGAPIGLMVRGDGEGFTDRAERLMRAWEMPEGAIAAYRALAEWLDHTNGFLKLEWHPTRDVDGYGRLIAYYFRRRPPVGEVVDYLGGQGVAPEILARVVEFADLLEKRSIHFVAAAMRPGRELRHKLYFSQYLTPERAGAVETRLDEAMARFGVGSASRDLLAYHHRKLAPPERTSTLFASVSFTVAAMVPGLKLDYPEVAPETAAALLPETERSGAEAEMRGLCAVVGLDRLSYLGVTLHPDRPPGLKYYADVMGTEETR
ncbi:MAG TPA: hypothetical protein VH482_29620 [Thermomicrobiales bacterium]|jgi:hypothetical protein